MTRPDAIVTLSIVSHGQGALIAPLLRDIAALDLTQVDIVLTLNLPEDESVIAPFAGPNLRVLRNDRPLGFGANHNQAFAASDRPVFCIVNPDIRLRDAAFLDLAATVAAGDVGACAPRVIGSDDVLQDSARRDMTLSRLFARTLLRRREPEYAAGVGAHDADWIAGMFVLFARPAYAAVGGFDERYFMYMEDADIARRLRRAGWRVRYDPGATVVHDARRASHRDLRHLRWHATGMVRYLLG